MELLGPLAEQLPVAVLFLLAAAAVARYAARLLDRLFAAQERIQAQLIDALERNTVAWRDTCAALASLEAAVDGLKQAGRAPRPVPRLRPAPTPHPALSQRERVKAPLPLGEGLG